MSRKGLTRSFKQEVNIAGCDAQSRSDRCSIQHGIGGKCRDRLQNCQESCGTDSVRPVEFSCMVFASQRESSQVDKMAAEELSGRVAVKILREDSFQICFQ